MPDKTLALESWARTTVFRKPKVQDYVGLSYEEASRRAQAICLVGARTGKTINASYHLDRLRDILLRG